MTNNSNMKKKLNFNAPYYTDKADIITEKMMVHITYDNQGTAEKMGESFPTHMKLEEKGTEDLNPSPTLEVTHLPFFSGISIMKHDKKKKKKTFDRQF